MSTDNDDLPGMLAVAKGVAKQEFPHTVDAQVWAAEFAKLNPAPSEDVMLAWFANAIMAGYDTATARSQTKMREFAGWLSGDIPELHGVEVPRLAESLDRFLKTS